MQRFIFFLLFLLFTCFACDTPDDSRSVSPEAAFPLVERDLEEIKSSGVLRAIMVYSETSYFLYRGQPMGFEYELLTRLAEELGVELEIIPAFNLDELINMLNRGEGDLIAHGLTITQPRKQYIDFSSYLFLTKQVLVQRKPEDWRQQKLHEIEQQLVSDPIELIEDTVSVRLSSSYFDRLQNLEQEIGGNIYIDTVSGDLSTGRIIKKVVTGDLEYTVADDNIAEINSAYYPILDVSTPISFSQRAAWAVRKNSPQLLQVLNKWIEDMREQTDYYVIYNRYFKNKRAFRTRIESEFYSEAGGKISRYDSVVQRFSDTLGWDWRFLSALIYQESQFNPSATSWAKAKGLMQLMPATARELGVTDRSNPEDNLEAGTTYLYELYQRWESIPDSVQRVKFTLASYNCGYQHVVDAQQLAEKYEKDPGIWDNNVETFVKRLSYPKYYNDPVVDYGYVRGIEPVTYVDQIFQRFEHYQKLIPESS
jgi:membrane-bound lytic murein transglycosylase F